MWKKHINKKHFAQSFLLTKSESIALFLVRFVLLHNEQIHGSLYFMKILNASLVPFYCVCGVPIPMVCKSTTE